METRQLREIFLRYVSKEASEEEAEALLEHFRSGKDGEYLQDLIAEHLDGEMPPEFEQQPDIQAMLSDVHQSLKRKLHDAQAQTNKPLPDETGPRQTIRKLLPWLSAAAIIIGGIATIWYFYLSAQSVVKPSSQFAAATDLPPGGNRATLTLADGRSILLDSARTGQLAEVGGMRISKTAGGQVVYEANGSGTAQPNTISTPRGGEYRLLLPDGTRVWLNAATTLSYPSRFTGAERKVKLSGEAYFEVAKDSRHPFIVESDGQQVKVLGTHFNINTYQRNRTVTTLEEGSVRVLGSDRLTQGVVLSPGQQATAQGTGITVGPANLEAALAWKNGQLYFADTDLVRVLEEVSRWYDVDIEYKAAPSAELFTGGISRGASLSSMLKVLRLSGVQATLQMQGTRKKLIIEP
ncbi:FecR family protein [Pedobacter sp. ASV28]|uniref:FecR family protein n=1 Tax=Pedobacter sp. ASV28 TaxID=2795123 RepID=UPI0018ED9DEF|nr:FecR family protein [Pedobacter sp. ASV28]